MTGAVLITGGAGSLGRRLTDRFIATGWQVRVLDLPGMDFSGLEEREEVQVIRSDIGEKKALRESLAGVGSVIHLAALLPPKSEEDRAATIAVNVGGTEAIVRVMEEVAPSGKFVFASSVSTYGNTSAANPPIGTDHPQRAIDVYAESKIRGESLIRESRLHSVVLRIAPIAVPAFLEPPDVWPFTPNQRVEMVHREDVADAMYGASISKAVAGRVLNIAGGPTWQRQGKSYVNDYYGFLGAPVEDASYRTSPGWVDWYDTEESQRLLRYQNRPYQRYVEEMRTLIGGLMAS